MPRTKVEWGWNSGQAPWVQMIIFSWNQNGSTEEMVFELDLGKWMETTNVGYKPFWVFQNRVSTDTEIRQGRGMKGSLPFQCLLYRVRITAFPDHPNYRITSPPKPLSIPMGFGFFNVLHHLYQKLPPFVYIPSPPLPLSLGCKLHLIQLCI